MNNISGFDSNCTNEIEIIAEIQRLNPTVRIVYDDDLSEAYSSVEPEDLVLPQGFYFSQKCGVTNKHNAKDGAYVAIQIILI